MKSRQQRSNSEIPELPDSVDEALAALKPVPPVSPAAWERGRAAFLAQARAMRPADMPQVVADGGARGVRGFFRRGDRRPLVLALRAVIAVIVVLLGSVGTVSAARASLPGSVLYPLKVQIEAWEINQSRNPEAVTRRALAQAQVRVDEATRLADRGEAVPADVAARYQEGLALALAASGDLDEPHRLKARTEISATVRHQLETMAQISARVGSEDDEEDASPVRAMIRTLEWTQAQLGEDAGEDHGGAAGDHDDQQVGEPVQQGPTTEPSPPAAGACDDDGACVTPPAAPADNGSGNGPGQGPGDDGGDAGPEPGDGSGEQDEAPGPGNGQQGGDQEGEHNGPGGPDADQGSGGEDQGPNPNGEEEDSARSGDHERNRGAGHDGSEAGVCPATGEDGACETDGDMRTPDAPDSDPIVTVEASATPEIPDADDTLDVDAAPDTTATPVPDEPREHEDDQRSGSTVDWGH